MQHVQAARSADAATSEHEWHHQSKAYGRQFDSIYDALFPINADARIAADLLFNLALENPSKMEMTCSPASFAEFGIGTARVALPLGELGARIVGADSSQELLQRAGLRITESTDPLSIELVNADIREWVSEQPVALSYCICATISMLQTQQEQLALLRNMADSTNSDGLVVIETHSPDRVRLLHRDSADVDFESQVQGIVGGMRTRSHLEPDFRSWSLQHAWDLHGSQSATEFSLLLESEQLVALASRVGLELADIYSGWRREKFDRFSPTYIAIFRRL